MNFLKVRRENQLAGNLHERRDDGAYKSAEHATERAIPISDTLWPLFQHKVCCQSAAGKNPHSEPRLNDWNR